MRGIAPKRPLSGGTGQAPPRAYNRGDVEPGFDETATVGLREKASFASEPTRPASADNGTDRPKRLIRSPNWRRTAANLEPVTTSGAQLFASRLNARKSGWSLISD